LVIGDAHCQPHVPNHRFEWLGRLLTDIQPDVVVDIGDWWDMESLNTFDRPGSKSYEGRKYWYDIESGIDAQERVQYQLDTYNRGKKKKYKPRLVRTLGNHDGGRILRALEDNPKFESMMGLHDLMSAEFGWEEIPYKEVVVIDGVAYSHSYPSGVMGRPIGGENPARSLLLRQYHTAIAGHNHLLDYCERNDATGRRIQAMFAGCYFHHELEWAGPRVNRMYARGLLLLNNVHEGQFDFEWLGMDRVRAKYG
ncbi:unnamed protein product, partial [marine sediment metagenome]